MEVSEALELLKGYLDELNHLRKIPYKNNEQYLWKDKVDVVLEATFGKDSDEYRKLNPRYSVSSPVAEGKERREYLQKLDWWETRIKQILTKYEITGFKTKLVDKGEKSKYVLKKVWRKPWNFIIVGIPVLAALVYVVDYFWKLFSK